MVPSRHRLAILLGCVVCVGAQVAGAQDGGLMVPKTVTAGDAFSIQSSGSGKATLYIVGPGGAVKRDVQLGETTNFAPGSFSNAGHYVVALVHDSSTEDGSFDVVPAANPAEISFLAKPSRLPVSIHDGITGAAYIFDSYHNLILTPMPVSFELSTGSDAVQKHVVTTSDGAAWTAMDSSRQQGQAKFVAQLDAISSTRIIGQVPGDPCGLKMSAQPDGGKIQVVTEPIRDCNGNAVPDGTIVTFTQMHGSTQSTVDVPIKRGIAEVQMPAINGSTITVASGVVLGNQIRWDR